MADIDDEWEAFLEDENEEEINEGETNTETITSEVAPEPTDIYISTRTEIAFLDQTIDLKKYFWLIPVNNYDDMREGVIKKQMKFISNNEEEFDTLQKNLECYSNNFVEQSIISTMKADIGNKKYKDVRKISIGISKKDMMTNRTKKKGAFYNCFVLIIRLMENSAFKEYHVKIFNTGKIELPGIQDTSYLGNIKNKIIEILSINNNKLSFVNRTLNDLHSNESILINSNFDCNYYLDRNKLFNILKYEYNLNTIYDPCTYPGVRCTFYYQDDITDGKQISETDKSITFMIFRTGSVLIVGKCSEENLHKIYEFIKKFLIDIYPRIVKNNIEIKKKQIVAKKTKRKIIVH
tara:strand:+ start:219 stop:1268 length:1050 start_codon:yes stop_codon:yes gene_type:complete